MQRQARRRRLGQVGDLEAHRQRRVAAEDADLAEIDAAGEADHPPGVAPVHQQEREADAREEHEEQRGEGEDRDREQAGDGEERAADDAPRAEDARHVDGEAGAIARALAVVALDLAAEVAEHEGARRDDEHAEEAEPVAEAAAEHGAGDEVQQREDDDLLVVRGSLARGQANDLESGGELDEHVEHVGVEEDAADLHAEHDQQRAGVEVPQRRVPLPRLAHRERRDQAEDDRRAHPAVELPAEHQRQHPERRERVGHHAVDEAEPHARPRRWGAGRCR